MEPFNSIKINAHKFNEPTILGKGLRFAYFIFLYFLLRYLELLIISTSFGIALLNPLHESLSVFITHTSCFFLQLFYPDIHVSNDYIIIIAKKTPIQMLSGCTGLSHMLRLSFVLLVYPMSWLQKGIVFIPTILIVLFAATLHFLILIPIAYHDPELYGFAPITLPEVYFLDSFFFVG